MEIIRLTIGETKEIPDWIKDKAYSYLDEPLKDVLRRWKQYIAPVRRVNQT